MKGNKLPFPPLGSQVEDQDPSCETVIINCSFWPSVPDTNSHLLRQLASLFSAFHVIYVSESGRSSSDWNCDCISFYFITFPVLRLAQKLPSFVATLKEKVVPIKSLFHLLNSLPNDTACSDCTLEQTVYFLFLKRFFFFFSNFQHEEFFSKTDSYSWFQSGSLISDVHTLTAPIKRYFPDGWNVPTVARNPRLVGFLLSFPHLSTSSIQ